jgi:hypothetical protein
LKRQYNTSQKLAEFVFVKHAAYSAKGSTSNHESAKAKSQLKATY